MSVSRTDQPTGRVMKFIHEGESELPVRDVKANYKGDSASEPYIEYGRERGLNEEDIIGAENYCAKCYAEAVKNVVSDGDEYLFLASYPHHDGANATENLIVGYVQNEEHEWRTEDRVAVIGKMELYSFEDGVPLSELGYEPTKRSLGPTGRDLDTSQTQKVLDHFRHLSPITEECLERTLELESDETSDSTNC